MKQVVLLGSTGSIGTQAEQVCLELGYRVLGISANRNAALAIQQVRRLSPRFAVFTDPETARTVQQAVQGSGTQVLCGMEELCRLAALPEADIVLNALSGMVGLRPTLEALRAGKTVALANKETLVAGGRLVVETARAHGGRLIPVDSEHTAIFQCIQGEEQNPIQKIILTASGGPFFGKTRQEMEEVTLEQTLRHPKWNMGRKISVDSATLMNKGLEFIECIWNFGVRPDQVEVVVHPETILHSAVEFADGSVMAQLSQPDMRLSIQYALTYPRREHSSVKPLSFTELGRMTFYPPDFDAFPCLGLAVQAITQGGLCPCILNAANEAAVQAYLDGRIRFGGIARLVQAALEQLSGTGAGDTLEQVLEADRAARQFAAQYITERL